MVAFERRFYLDANRGRGRTFLLRQTGGSPRPPRSIGKFTNAAVKVPRDSNPVKLASLFYLPILFLPSTRLPVQFDLGGTFAVIYLGAFISFGAYGLYNSGVSRIPVSQASAFVNLIPVFTVQLGWLILGEQFTPT